MAFNLIAWQQFFGGQDNQVVLKKQLGHSNPLEYERQKKNQKENSIFFLLYFIEVSKEM